MSPGHASQGATTWAQSGDESDDADRDDHQ
jgi:hypothetical protein